GVKRVSATGTALPSLRFSSPSLAIGTCDSGGEAGTGLKQRPRAAAGGGGAVTVPPRPVSQATVAAANATYLQSSPSKSCLISLDASHVSYLGLTKIPPAGMVSSSSTSSISPSISPQPPQPSPVGLQEQQLACVQHQAAVLPPRVAQPSPNGAPATLPSIATFNDSVAPTGARAASPSPIPRPARGASPSHGCSQDIGFTGGVAAVWRLAAPAASRDARDVTPNGRSSEADASSPSALLSTSWSGGSWPYRPSSSCSNKGVPEENLTVCRSGAAFSSRHQRPQGASQGYSRTGPLLCPPPKELSSTPAAGPAVITSADAGAFARPANAPATPAHQPPLTQQPPLGQRSLTLMVSPRTAAAGDAEAQGPLTFPLQPSLVQHHSSLLPNHQQQRQVQAGCPIQAGATAPALSHPALPQLDCSMRPYSPGAPSPGQLDGNAAFVYAGSALASMLRVKHAPGSGSSSSSISRATSEQRPRHKSESSSGFFQVPHPHPYPHQHYPHPPGPRAQQQQQQQQPANQEAVRQVAATASTAFSLMSGRCTSRPSPSPPPGPLSPSLPQQ
ncbi:hypothetical protein VaNZ11_009329, partial [Volvox africanus]